MFLNFGKRGGRVVCVGQELLRKLAYVHRVISDTIVYPHYSVIPELRRNGMRGRLPECHPQRLMQALLADPRMETLMKRHDHKAIKHFIDYPSDLDRCWQSYKVAARLYAQ